LIIIEDIEEIRKVANTARQLGKSVALVPTMGFLHQGHLNLVKEASKHADLVIVSIFLNPTQFNLRSDFDRYPRNLERDLELLRSERVDSVFCPKDGEIYPDGADTWVSVDSLSNIHEGEFRPGHFRGVTTVVNILFNVVSPDVAVFGEKDFQQLGLIRKMVKDLHLPIKLIGLETVREAAWPQELRRK
jgi:pantoate--beta-alanine ligase